jgi:hypothetical protein
MHHECVAAAAQTAARPIRRRPHRVGTIIEALFWPLLAQAMSGSDIDRDRWIDSATHVTYHALFTDAPRRAVRWTRKSRRRRA